MLFSLDNSIIVQMNEEVFLLPYREGKSRCMTLIF